MPAETLAWQRPTIRQMAVGCGFTEIDVPRTLASHGFFKSGREALRHIHLLWCDDALPSDRTTTIYDRMRRIGDELRDNRFWLVEAGDVLLVGKNQLEAACHRLIIVGEGVQW